MVNSAEASSRFETFALASGIAAPVLYFASVAAGALTYAGFSPVRQLANELGSSGAPHRLVFNVGVVLSGIATVLACLGFWRVLARLGARDVWRRWACICTGLIGAALVAAGIFPFPGWPHLVGTSLGMPALFAPVLLALALLRRPDLRLLRRYLLVTNIVMVVELTAFIGARGSNVLGLSQLLFTLLAMQWIAVAAYVLLRVRNAEGAGTVGPQTVDSAPGNAPHASQTDETPDTLRRAASLGMGIA